jgi:hypothetical protein
MIWEVFISGTFPRSRGAVCLDLYAHFFAQRLQFSPGSFYWLFEWPTSEIDSTTLPMWIEARKTQKTTITS